MEVFVVMDEDGSFLENPIYVLTILQWGQIYYDDHKIILLLLFKQKYKINKKV